MRNEAVLTPLFLAAMCAKEGGEEFAKKLKVEQCRCAAKTGLEYEGTFPC